MKELKRTSILLIAMAVLIAPSMAWAKTITLTYSNFFPPTHVQSILAQEWCNEVEARTNGQVKVDYYPAGTLTKAQNCYDGVVEGLSDIGLSAVAYTRGRFPVLGAVDLPMGYTSGVQATRVANAVYNKFQPKEFNDTAVMFFHAHGPGLVHTKGKAVRTIDDMKGLKFKATGYSAKVVSALGGVPVGMPMPETYQSIQKGVVDGGVYPLESNKGWKLGEITDYATAAFSAAYTTVFYVVMNKDKWDSLPVDVQKTIQAINEEWIVKHGKAWDDSDFEGIKFFLEQGNEIIGVDKKESQKWEAAVAPIADEYATELDGKGLNGTEIINFIRESMK